MRSLLDDVNFLGHLEDRVSSLSVARRHLLELAKAFAVSPRLLILDEPTAPLSQDSVELLFTAVRKLAAGGTAIVYITHRLAEVRAIADRVTVLRDGTLRGTSAVERHLRRRPARHDRRAHARDDLPAEACAATPARRRSCGRGAQRKRLRRHLVHRRARARSSGVAGVAGNGQPALLRALAGREPSSGTVNVGGEELSRRELLEQRGLHAGRPAHRGTDGRPERARERRDDRARPAHGAARS